MHIDNVRELIDESGLYDKENCTHKPYWKVLTHDSGLTGRQLRWCSKVDRSGLYAKHIVAGLADIGVARPTSVAVDTYGTYTKVNDDVLGDEELTPNWITKQFSLDKPSADTFLYADVAARGQADYPWEKLRVWHKY